MALEMVPGGTQQIDITDGALDNLFVGGGTICFWIFPNGNLDSFRNVMEQRFDEWNLRLRSPSSNLWRWSLDVAFATTNGIWFSESAPRVFPEDVWYFFTLTYDSGDVANDPSFYLNAVADTIQEGQTPVGAAVNGTDDWKNGENGDCDAIFADQRFYDRILSQAEITTIEACRGHDGIVDGLLTRHTFREKADGQNPTTAADELRSLTGVGHAVAKSAAETYRVDQLSTRKRVA